MNTKDYKIPEYGMDVQTERELLTADNIDSVSGFFGTLDDLDFIEFLNEYAIDDTTTRTYIYRNKENGEAVAFVSLACSVIAEEHDDATIEYAPAVLIDKFMVDEKYRHLQYKPDNTDHVLASMIFLDTLEYIEELTKTVIGAQYVVLYSTPEAYTFYLNKCKMKNFAEYMRRNDDSRTDFCTPMYCLI